MKIKSLTLIVFAAVYSTLSTAQNNTGSPYSTRGFGESEAFVNAFSRSLGGAINGIRTGRTLSFSNPASYGALRNVSADFGFRFDYFENSSANGLKTGNNGNFNYFGLAFPAYKKLVVKDTSRTKNENKLYREYNTIWSMGFGIIPYSGISVSYFKVQDTAYGQTVNFYSKKGGLNRFYFANAINIKPNLSIGLNSSLIFGQKKSNESYYVYDTGVSRATFRENNIQMNGFRFDLGIQGERNKDTIVRQDSVTEGGKRILKTWRYPVRFVYGATYSNNSSIRYNEFNQILNRSNFYSTAPVDTILSENNIKGKTNLPASFSAGFSVTFNKLWMITADYKADFLSKQDRNLFSSDSFTNASQISIGFAYRPDQDVSFGEMIKSNKRKANLEYRFGFRLLNTGYLFKDNIGSIQTLKEYGISFGIGIPKSRVEYDGRAKVMMKNLFNITGEYVHRGNTLNGMISENIYRITIGFTFQDIWFKQRKFY